MLAEAIVLIPRSANKGTEIQMDVLPLVLCKDCKHQNWVNAETGCIVCKIGRGTNAPDWFCADGEEKEGGGS